MIELAKTASSPKYQPPAAPPAEETRRTEEKKALQDNLWVVASL
jgi:hypothetical protein